MLAGKSETISFRLDYESYQLLVKQAGKAQMSRHEFAKKLVVDSLANEYQESTKDLLLEIRHDLNLLREEHITATNALLVTAGKLNPEKAAEFIERRLLKRDL